MNKIFAKQKFASHVFNIIASQYPQTYFVGGAVRNFLLGHKISDIDIATIATPEQVTLLLKKDGVSTTGTHKKFGVIVASKGTQKVEITTFRKDSYLDSRYPKISLTKSVKTDSTRRDFTINALYYSPLTKELLDFHNGLADIKNKRLKFIGNADKRIKEDPLRIIRAYRFALQYNLQFENKTKLALQKNKVLIKKISQQRLQKEINTLLSQKLRAKLKKVIHNDS